MDGRAILGIGADQGQAWVKDQRGGQVGQRAGKQDQHRAGLGLQPGAVGVDLRGGDVAAFGEVPRQAQTGKIGGVEDLDMVGIKGGDAQKAGQDRGPVRLRGRIGWEGAG